MESQCFDMRGYGRIQWVYYCGVDERCGGAAVKVDGGGSLSAGNHFINRVMSCLMESFLSFRSQLFPLCNLIEFR